MVHRLSVNLKPNAQRTCQGIIDYSTEKQYINYFENQVEYKLSEKSSLMQS